MSVLCFMSLRRFSEAKVRNFKMSFKKNIFQNYIREKVELSYVTLSKIINTISYYVVCDAALLLSEMRFVYICSMSCPYSVSYRSTPIHLRLQMTHNQDWDLEKYNSPHEPKHHWQLKKKFMEHHKDRFPESELVS